MITEEADTGRILVVDDNEMNRDMLSRRLLKQGHTVETSVNGRHALDMLNAGEYDLVLLDIMMPEMNGFELLEHIRGDDVLRHIPVILISALDDADSVVQGIRMGADDHLPKPFNPLILRARVSACLARKRLRDREQMYAKALAREIDIAREIQAGFLPDVLPTADGWELGARFRPARSVAGDFYDAFPLHDGRCIGIVMADVCDKGVGAALFMALFRTLLRALAERTLTLTGDPEEEVRLLITGINDYIAQTHSRANMFATIFLGVLDTAAGEMVYANGGHDAPAIVAADGTVRRLEPTGPAVGMMPEMQFGSARTHLAAGETLFAFTDGVTDSRDASGAVFSEERLLELVTAPAASAAALLDRVEAAVQDHAGDAAPFDDITLFAVRRLVPG